MTLNEILEPTKKRRRRIKEAEPLMHRGYPCTKDCSGHYAGDLYAQNNGITDPRQCPYGNSNSFWEGCKSEAESHQ